MSRSMVIDNPYYNELFTIIYIDLSLLEVAYYDMPKAKAVETSK